MDKPVSEVVERVARALADANMAENAGCDVYLAWEQFVPMAIAAIKAMREPSSAMTGDVDVDEASNGWAGWIWSRMIDVLLSEGD